MQYINIIIMKYINELIFRQIGKKIKYNIDLKNVII